LPGSPEVRGIASPDGLIAATAICVAGTGRLQASHPAKTKVIPHRADHDACVLFTLAWYRLPWRLNRGDGHLRGGHREVTGVTPGEN